MYTELYLTEDGSHTLYVKELDECYHSTHGAIQESNHIFIKAGLLKVNKQQVSLLEVGFGTGLNAFLTLYDAYLNKQTIRYTSIEKYPLSIDQVLQLNYTNTFPADFKNYFELIHKAAWNQEVEINPWFFITKIKADFTQIDLPDCYDLVYFDAFSPEKQPEMWSEEIFKQIFKHCNSNAILTTYCAKGIVRRALELAGFKVERLLGPPGKREILRGRKLI